MSENPIDDFELEKPVSLKGSISEDRTLFYDLAKERIEYQSRDENKGWWEKLSGKKGVETVATYVIGANNTVTESGNLERYVETLKIVVNRGIFEEVSEILGEDFTDLIPYVVEHDVYEAWLSAKRGAGQSLDTNTKHKLARRREFYLAEKAGLGDKLLKFQMAVNPNSEEEYKGNE